MIIRKYFIPLLLILCFIFNFGKVNSVITFNELYYGNSSTSFFGYPARTLGGCNYKIPIQFSSNSFSISTIAVSTPFTISTTYVSSDGNEIIVTVETSSNLFGPLNFQISAETSGQPSSQFSLSYYCVDFQYDKINHTVLHTGVYYNTLSAIVKFNEYLVVPNVTLDIDVTVPYTQAYIGDNTYSISFHYNTPSILFNSNYLIPIKFSNGFTYQITINRPFQHSNILPSTKAYPSSLKIKDAVYYELIGAFNGYSNDYFSTFKNISQGYYDEPFLISSNKYLSVLSSPFYELAPTTYSLSYYYLNSNRLLFNSSVAQSTKSFYFSLSTASLSSFYVVSSSIPINIQYPLIFRTSKLAPELRYPFGLARGNVSSGFDFSFAISNQIVNNNSQHFYINDMVFEMNSTNSSTQKPAPLSGFLIQLIPNGKMRVIINSTGSTGVAFYDSPTSIYRIYSIYESTIDMSNTIFNFILPRFNLYKIGLVNTVESSYYIGSSYIYRLNGQYQSLKSVQDLDVLPSNFNYTTALKSVSFLHNDLVVTNRGLSNKMFIKLENYPIDREVKVTFIYSDYRANEKKDVVYSWLNQLTGQFEFEFNIPKNIKTGNVSYTITLDSLDNINYFSYSLASEYQLRVLESNNIDLFGPVVTSIQPKSNFNQFKTGYVIEISDSANGFKYGYIIVRGSIDMTERNLTITPSNLYAGTMLKGAYFIGFNYDDPCIQQTFSIVYAYFEDTEGYSTEYDVVKVNKKNPFYPILDIFENQNGIVSVCGDIPFQSVDGIKKSPTLLSLVLTPIAARSSESSRIATFNYTVYHPDGISTTNLPKVYALYPYSSYLISFETLVASFNSTHTTFSSKMLFPYVPSYYSISIYGVVSKSSTIGGFSPDYLKSNNISFEYGVSIQSFIPIFDSSSKLSSTGLGGLWLYGRNLNQVDSSKDFQIRYTDEDGSVFRSIVPSLSYPDAVYFSTIKATTMPVIIKVSNELADPFTVYPVVYDFNPSDSSSTSTSLCFGSPVLCGGPLQGTCTSSGCKCISPWIGNDCMSRVIQVPPPTINETNPSTNITIGDDKDSTISSIISIVGIKELSIDSTELNRYYFEEWDYRMIFNDSYITRYTYSSYIKKDHIKVSNITVTLDWYKVESTIQFANEELHINPSTIKYTIKISSYPFSTQLSTLQLIMKASIQNGNKQSCSNKQFGESIQDDADYVKLQINNYSFYGRFIKRCQIDNDQTTKLSNTLLDSTMNDTITNDNEQTSQSYIGINIPQFKDNVTIDPDFSVLVDSSDNSNCKDNSNSGLTKSQLAGIIVGSVSLFIVLLIIISIIIYKSPGCLNTKIFIYKLFKKSNK